VCGLISWLHDNVPPEDGSADVAAVAHGDFRLDNMVFDPQLQVGHGASGPAGGGGGKGPGEM
jgi:aminoglycoside phosphotransferase (APT) family kinase protein